MTRRRAANLILWMAIFMGVWSLVVTCGCTPTGCNNAEHLIRSIFMPIQMGDHLTQRLEKMVTACKAHTDECHAVDHVHSMVEPAVSVRPIQVTRSQPMQLPQPKR